MVAQRSVVVRASMDKVADRGYIDEQQARQTCRQEDKLCKLISSDRDKWPKSSRHRFALLAAAVA